MNHGEEIEAPAIGMDVIVEHVLNVAQPGHIARRNGIGEHSHRLSGGNNCHGHPGVGCSLSRNGFPQRQVGCDAVTPGRCSAGVAFDHRAGAGLQARPGFGQENLDIRVVGEGQRRIIRRPVPRRPCRDMRHQRHRLGQHQHPDPAPGQSGAGIDTLGLGPVIPVPGQGRAIDDLIFDAGRLAEVLQRRPGQRWQIGAEQAVPDKENIGNQRQQPHHTHPLRNPTSGRKIAAKPLPGQLFQRPASFSRGRPAFPEVCAQGQRKGACTPRRAVARASRRCRPDPRRGE